MIRLAEITYSERHSPSMYFLNARPQIPMGNVPMTMNQARRASWLAHGLPVEQPLQGARVMPRRSPAK